MNALSAPESMPEGSRPHAVWISLGVAVLAATCGLIVSVIWTEFIPLDVREEITYGIQGFFDL